MRYPQHGSDYWGPLQVYNANLQDMPMHDIRSALDQGDRSPKPMASRFVPVLITAPEHSPGVSTTLPLGKASKVTCEGNS